ncbi:transposase [Candidatus Bathyarchaeota archaeon]|nr:transposase [Candidatus Bathyarchaeota archaeon]
MIGYDGFKHRKGSKIHACVDEGSMPLSIALGAGNGHDSKRIDELLEGLKEAPKELYADSAYDTEAIRYRLSSMNGGKHTREP